MRMPSTAQLRRDKMLAAAIIIGGVSILTATGILVVLHLLRYLPAVTGILVGLHLLPLSVPYRRPSFRVFGMLLVAWSAGCLLLTTHLALFSTMGELVLAAGLATNTLLRKPNLLEA